MYRGETMNFRDFDSVTNSVSFFLEGEGEEIHYYLAWRTEAIYPSIPI